MQAETADGRDLLCFLPAKFNKKLWIKRGGYIIVEEGDTDVEDKVTATIVKVLFEQDVKALRKIPGVWYAMYSYILTSFTGLVLMLNLFPDTFTWCPCWCVQANTVSHHTPGRTKHNCRGSSTFIRKV